MENIKTTPAPIKTFFVIALCGTEFYTALEVQAVATATTEAIGGDLLFYGSDGAVSARFPGGTWRFVGTSLPKEHVPASVVV